MKKSLLVTLAAFFLATLAGPVFAATFVVTKTEDTADGTCDANDCSLREAVIAANANADADTISVPAGLYILSRVGSDDTASAGDLDILHETTIEGDGSEATFIDAFLISDRIFHVLSTSTGDFTLRGVNIRNGAVSGTEVGFSSVLIKI